MFVGNFVTPPHYQVLQTAKQRGHSRTAAERNPIHSTGGQPRLGSAFFHVIPGTQHSTEQPGAGVTNSPRVSQAIGDGRETSGDRDGYSPNQILFIFLTRTHQIGISTATPLTLSHPSHP